VKQNEIQVGGHYLTRIGQELAHVVVIRSETRTSVFSKRVQTRFIVRRHNEATSLPKARSAAALRPLEHSKKCMTEKLLSGDDACPACGDK